MKVTAIWFKVTKVTEVTVNMLKGHRAHSLYALGSQSSQGICFKVTEVTVYMLKGHRDHRLYALGSQRSQVYALRSQISLKVIEISGNMFHGHQKELRSKELSFCHKLLFSNHYIFGTRYCRPLIFQTMNYVRSNN